MKLLEAMQRTQRFRAKSLENLMVSTTDLQRKQLYVILPNIKPVKKVFFFQSRQPSGDEGRQIKTILSFPLVKDGEFGLNCGNPLRGRSSINNAASTLA